MLDAGCWTLDAIIVERCEFDSVGYTVRGWCCQRPVLDNEGKRMRNDDSVALPRRMLVVWPHCTIPIAGFSPRFDPGLRARLAGLRGLVVLRDRRCVGTALRIAKRDHAANLGGQVLDHVASELLLLPLVLNDQVFPVVLVHVRPPHLLDLVQNEDEDLFGTLVALGAVGGGVADVAPGDVCRAVNGEGDAIRQFLAPA